MVGGGQEKIRHSRREGGEEGERRERENKKKVMEEVDKRTDKKTQKVKKKKGMLAYNHFIVWQTQLTFSRSLQISYLPFAAAS